MILQPGYAIEPSRSEASQMMDRPTVFQRAKPAYLATRPHLQLLQPFSLLAAHYGALESGAAGSCVKMAQDFQQFTSTSLCPPSLPSSPTPSPTPPPFHFPGPSSRFNVKHERSRGQHTFQRSYTPTAPSLSTAQRAHRRAQSSANVPTVKRLFSSPSPALSNERSHAQRAPMSRFYSYTPNRVPQTMYSPSPVTPAARRNSRPSSKLQDSPFSDYFTDDGLSNGNGNESSYRAPSEETRQLVVRLSKLQAQLMRSSPEDVLSEHEKAVIVERKVSEIETQFHALSIETQSQTRLPPDLEDSGLFMEDEDSAESEETPEAQMKSFEDAAKAYLASDTEGEDVKAKHDALLRDAHTVLQNVNKANEQLRKLNSELRASHEKCGSIIDNLESENEQLCSKTNTLELDHNAIESTVNTLKTENVSLKADLNTNRGELIFLKLRHRSLEMEVEALHNASHRLGNHVPELREELHQIQRTKIKERMSAWEDHWVEIQERMRERRTRRDSSGTEESLAKVFGMRVDDDEGSETVEGAEMSVEVEQKPMSVLGEDSAVGMEFSPSPPPAEFVPENLMAVVSVNKGTQTEPEVKEDTQTGTQIPKPIYVTQMTQTTPLPSPTMSSWLLADENDGQSNTNPDDCAITTSSEDNDGDESDAELSVEVEIHEEVEVQTPTSPIRVAWQDLWDGLTNLAGMGEGH